MIYAAITYTLLTLLHTIANIPYCALGGVITNNPTQHISLQSWHSVLTTTGGMLSTVPMTPLVNLIGDDNKPLGFQGGIATLSAVTFMTSAFCFFTTKEHIGASPTTTSMRNNLRNIWQSDQRCIVGFLTIFNILAVYVRGGVMTYCVTWILSASEAFVAFLTTCYVGNLIGSALTKPLTGWKCKVTILWRMNTLLAMVSLVMSFVPMQASIAMLVFIFVTGVLHQLATLIRWVMIFDTVGYGEWCNGKHLTGISSTGTLFVLKLGLAFGSVLIDWMLAYGGHDAAEKVQNGATISITIALFAIIPAICYLLSAIIVKRYYSLTTHNLKTVMKQLVQSKCHCQQQFISQEMQN